jgi:hypothetical protein
VILGLPSYRGRAQGIQWYTRVAGIYCDSAVCRVTPRFLGGLRRNSMRMFHFLGCWSCEEQPVSRLGSVFKVM